MFIPPINLGSWKPSPATLSEWIYQIWKYLQENPIATQEQIKEFINEQIGDDISEKLPEVLPEELDNYFEQNPIDFPVDSVNGKLGAVLLELADIVKSDSMLPIVSLANDEADQITLVNAFIDGARFCLIDETTLSVMLPTYGQDGGVTAITLLPVASGGGGGGDFSPITLSIGSSGNKTLNAGGTVAFTLQEIGAASGGDLTTLAGRVTIVEGALNTLSGNVGDLADDVDDLQNSVVPTYGPGDTITLTSGFRVIGSIPGNSATAFALVLPLKVAPTVNSVTITSTANFVVRPTTMSGNTASPVQAPFSDNSSDTYYSTGTVAIADLGVLNLVLHHPAISVQNVAALVTIPTGAVIHFKS